MPDVFVGGEQGVAHEEERGAAAMTTTVRGRDGTTIALTNFAWTQAGTIRRPLFYACLAKPYDNDTDYDDVTLDFSEEDPLLFFRPGGVSLPEALAICRDADAIATAVNEVRR